MEVFTIHHLNFAYPEQEKQAISDLSLSVRPGEFLVLCGPSGCGKSTLLRQLKTVLAPHGRRSGEILFENTPLDALSQREQAEKIGFVQQSPENQIATDKVWHELAFGPESLGYDTPTIRRRVAEMAGFFGMESWFHRETASLSGGQKQRLCIARALAVKPEVLLMDEPTSALDPGSTMKVEELMSELKKNYTVVIVTHNMQQAARISDRTAFFLLGELVEYGDTETMFSTPSEKRTEDYITGRFG